MVSVFSSEIAIKFMFLMVFYGVEGKQESYSVSFYLLNAIGNFRELYKAPRKSAATSISCLNHIILCTLKVQVFLRYC